jgi:hypothetical protein
MKHSRPWEADSCSATKEIHRMYVFITSFMHATFPARPNLLDLITIIFTEKQAYKFWRSSPSSFLQPPVTSFLSRTRSKLNIIRKEGEICKLLGSDALFIYLRVSATMLSVAQTT